MNKNKFKLALKEQDEQLRRCHLLISIILMLNPKEDESFKSRGGDWLLVGILEELDDLLNSMCEVSPYYDFDKIAKELFPEDSLSEDLRLKLPEEL